ncbi:phosphoserine phosphatase SerB [Catenovulum adriaticum]|uniref:Phosphoserine phosphatase n=1 Tax=Catenovulum adriaticum TaxID=2984846 RepID=A0ABY7AL21_9ALTE|nr:phosphoserine phosphatase SerB [Catenovulum sp. TS8]WAJ69011.1 phosphoserine phosphatase SerB [Catenovulum sp. TS8]
MNPFVQLNAQAIQADQPIAQLFSQPISALGNQTIELEPLNPLNYRLTQASLVHSPELVIYAKAITLAQCQHIIQLCQANQVEFISARLINAIDGGDDCAISWQLAKPLETSLLAQIKVWAEQQKIEVWQLLQRPNLSEPGLLLMDMDSTTIKIECIDEIAKLAGVGKQVAEVTELAMQGKLDFAESLRARVATLKDCDEAVLQSVANNLPLMHGLERLISALKKHDWKVAIASGGFTFFADQLKTQLGLDAAVANSLSIESGKLTGKVEGEIVDAQVKARTLTELANEFDIAQSQTVAMGDGANDLVMMDAADLGVAFEAKPIVQQKADVAINHHGLDALLFMLKA